MKKVASLPPKSPSECIPASNKVSDLPPPSLLSSTVQVKGKQKTPQLEIPVKLSNPMNGRVAMALALIDSGSTASVMDINFAKLHGFPLPTLDFPLITWNADGTTNSAGMVKHTVKVMLEFGLGHRETITCLLGEYKSHKLILGDDWLRKHNPSIDWTTWTLAFDRCEHLACSVTRSIRADAPDWVKIFPKVFGQD